MLERLIALIRPQRAAVDEDSASLVVPIDKRPLSISFPCAKGRRYRYCPVRKAWVPAHWPQAGGR